MGWWPFGRRSTPKEGGTRSVRIQRDWLIELQEMCERNFDSPEEARRRIRILLVEWEEAEQQGRMSSIRREGLERRAFHLLRTRDDEWTAVLDNLEFWKPGWGAPSATDED